MPAFDYHLHSENIGETISTAKQLGFSGICLVSNWANIQDIEKFKAAILPYKKQIDISIGIEIKDKPNKIPHIVESIRQKAEIILVHGGELEANRVAVETPGVDILLHPEMGREDSGIDHVMARLAKKSNVAIEFSLNDLIQSSKETRAKIIRGLVENAKLIKKYKAPFVLTSGAFGAFGLRSPSELFSFGKVLGFQDKEIKLSLSDFIIKENRKRLSGKWVMPGVELTE